MKTRITSAVVIVLQDQGKYLLTLRQEKNINNKNHNCWHFPGGAQKYKESITDAVKREADEELGVEVKIKCLIPKVYDVFRLNFHGIFHYYLCSLTNNKQKIILNSEASDFQWYKADEIAKLKTVPHTYQIAIEAEKIGVGDRT